MTDGLHLFAVTGIGEVQAGDDLAALLVQAITSSGEALRAGDVLVISSKVVSKAEGRVVPAATREAQIIAETVRPVAARRTPSGISRIVEAAAGPVMAAAGVDNSNVAPGTVLLLPKDPDGSARALRARLLELTGTPVGVIVSDTAGRTWRDGQVDFALGAAGVAVTDDLRGAVDTHGQPLEVTVRALADELAAAADLVKGKLRGVPAAVVRGTGLALDAVGEEGPGAASLLRPARTDWFRYGHVEAVRAGLGVPEAAVPPPSIPADDVRTRLHRALDVAQYSGRADAVVTLDGGSAFGSRLVLRSENAEDDAGTEDAAGPENAVSVQNASVELRLVTERPEAEDWMYLGALAARIRVAAWSEDLVVQLNVTSGPPPALRITAQDLWPG